MNSKRDKHTKGEQGIQRRRFLFALSGWLLTISTVVFSFASAKFIRRTSRHKRKIILDMHQLRNGLNTTEQLLIIRGNDQFTVLSRRCPHLGCRVELQPDQNGIVCPCHGSRFKPDGTFVNGPAQQNLQSLHFVINKEEHELSIEL